MVTTAAKKRFNLNQKIKYNIKTTFFCSIIIYEGCTEYNTMKIFDAGVKIMIASGSETRMFSNS